MVAKDYFIVVAGGKGLRMGGSVPKQFMELHGRPLLMRTLERLAALRPEYRIVLVLPRDNMDLWKSLCLKYNFSLEVILAEGGATRFESVKNGLAKVPDEADGCVGIHDGVRPFVACDVVERCWETARREGCAIPVVRPVESVRLESVEGSRPYNRDHCLLVQTPQVFQIARLRQAYLQPYNPAFTDDASVWESAGNQTFVVEGNRENIKVTTPFDLAVAEAILKSE